MHEPCEGSFEPRQLWPHTGPALSCELRESAGEKEQPGLVGVAGARGWRTLGTRHKQVAAETHPESPLRAFCALQPVWVSEPRNKECASRLFRQQRLFHAFSLGYLNSLLTSAESCLSPRFTNEEIGRVLPKVT